MLETLIASLFRPHNSYCIFVDAKATTEFQNLVQQLVNCYRLKYPQVRSFYILKVFHKIMLDFFYFYFYKANIFVVKDTHPIYWAHISMLMADIKCLDLLLKSDFSRLYQWQYFINQPATALPTMKVDEIADMLNQHRGHCDSIVYTPHKLCPKDSIYSIRNSSFDDRFHYKFQLRYKSFLIRING